MSKILCKGNQIALLTSFNFQQNLLCSQLRMFSSNFRPAKGPSYHKEDLANNPDYLKFANFLAKSLSLDEMKSCQAKIQHILSFKQVYAKMFMEKPKMIKYSLQLFTVDADQERKIFEKDDETLKQYLTFIDQKLVKNANSAMSLIQLLQASQTLRINPNTQSAFFISLLSKLTQLLNKHEFLDASRASDSQMRTVANAMQLLTYFGGAPTRAYEKSISETVKSLTKYL